MIHNVCTSKNAGINEVHAVQVFSFIFSVKTTCDIIRTFGLDLKKNYITSFSTFFKSGLFFGKEPAMEFQHVNLHCQSL